MLFKIVILVSILTCRVYLCNCEVIGELYCGDTVTGTILTNGEHRFEYKFYDEMTIVFDSCQSSFDTYAYLYDYYQNKIDEWYVYLICNTINYINLCLIGKLIILYI